MKRLLSPITTETSTRDFALTPTDIKNLLSQIDELQNSRVSVQLRENALIVTVGNIEYRVEKNKEII